MRKTMIFLTVLSVLLLATSGKPAFAITQASKNRYSRGALILSGGSEAYQYDQIATRLKLG